MSAPVIRVENLSKRYRIGESQGKFAYGSLRDSLENAAKASLQRLRRLTSGSPSNDPAYIWALKDVFFEVQPGETLGIIGRNGAGKSTLLKILSRITKPTEGRAIIRGRVGSLLEVGTGFHPELTGRENIYLNGSILGMQRREIDLKFDEIVSFSEIEKFLDTPVKYYSSGMYVRLAFAVAAHLEPEILLVDEVLAVGDIAFQKKCLGKMEDVVKEGRTVLFVSHNMGAIISLCTRSIYLVNGSLEIEGATNFVVDSYLANMKLKITSTALKNRQDWQGTGSVKIIDFHVEDELGAKQHILRSGEDYVFVMAYEKASEDSPSTNIVASIGLTNANNDYVLLLRSNFTNQNLNLIENEGQIRCHVADLNLAEGSYGVIIFLSQGEHEILFLINDAAEIIVEGGDFFRTGSLGLPSICKVLTRANWSLG